MAANTSASGQLQPLREVTLALGGAGRIEEVIVQAGDRVEEGDVLVRLESAAFQRAVRSAEQALAIQEASLIELQQAAPEEEVAAAEAAVASAQAQLDALIEGPGEEELTSAEASLRAAEAQVLASARQRDQVAAGPTAAEIAAAEANLLQAEQQQRAAEQAHEATMACYTVYCITISWEGGSQEVCASGPDVEIPDNIPDDLPLSYSGVTERESCPGLGPREEQARYSLGTADKNLEAAQSSLDLLLAGVDANQLGAAQANVSAAAAQRDVAQAQLDLLKIGSTAAQIAAARAQLAQAEASLAALLAGASAERLTMAEAQVEQAQIALEEALDSLDSAVLVAPFAGVVTAVYVEEGEFPSGPAVELVDDSNLEVVLEVDEVDIGGIAVGQPAAITLEAWPDDEFVGEVVFIAPRATIRDLVTYEVRLSIDAGDTPVRTGMTANAKLVTAERKDVLLVPNRAITADRETGTYTVNRYQGGGITKVEVIIGLRDREYTEVIGGLEAGDQLAIGEFEEEEWVPGQGQGPPVPIREITR